MVLIRLLNPRLEGDMSVGNGARRTRNKRVTLRSECGDAKLRNDGREEILGEVQTRIADFILTFIVGG